jgi:hypothetical protein
MQSPLPAAIRALAGDPELEVFSMQRLLNFFRKFRRPARGQAPKTALRRSFRPTLEALERREVCSVSAVSGAGGVIPGVEVETVYMGNQWNSNSTLKTESQQMNTFFNNILNSKYMDLLNQYCVVGRGSLIGSHVDDWITGFTPGTTITDSSIQYALAIDFNYKHDLPQPNSVRLYVVFLPANVSYTRTDINGNTHSSTTDEAGYHSFYHDSGTNTNVYYAVIPNPVGNNYATGLTGSESTLQKMTVVSSHELAEGVTNPDLKTGFWDRTKVNANGTPNPTYADEIGDIPQATLSVGNVAGLMNGYLVQKEWSNNDNASVLPSSNAAYQTQYDGQVSGIASVSTGGTSYIFGIGGYPYLEYKQQLSDGTWSGWSRMFAPPDLFNPTNSSGYPNWVVVTSIVASSDSHGWRIFVNDQYGMVWTMGASDQTWYNMGNFWSSPYVGPLSQVAPSFRGDGRPELIGLGYNGQVYVTAATGNGANGWWGNTWQQLPAMSGVTFNYIAAGFDPGANRDAVYGIDNNTTLWVSEQTSSSGGFGPWASNSFGGGFKSVVVSHQADGRVDLLVIDQNNALLSVTQATPGNWSYPVWQYLGGWVTQVTVGINQDGRQQVFALGGGNSIWSLMQMSPNDDWSDSHWYSLGGYANALSVSYDNNFWTSNYGELSLNVIGTDGRLWTAQQTVANGGFN